jgi:hypothetical protein
VHHGHHPPRDRDAHLRRSRTHAISRWLRRARPRALAGTVGSAGTGAPGEMPGNRRRAGRAITGRDSLRKSHTHVTGSRRYAVCGPPHDPPPDRGPARSSPFHDLQDTL